MAKAKKLPSGRWRIQVYDYTDENGKIYRKSFTAETKKEAEFLAADYKLKKREKNKPENMTVGEAMEKYIRSKENVLSPATIRGYWQIHRNTLQSIKNTKLCDLDQNAIQVSINHTAASYSPKSVANIHGLLSSTLNMFYPDFKLDTTLPQKVRPDIDIPDNNTIRRILEYIKDTEIEVPVLLAACGGLRRSEIAALTYDDFNFDENTVTINKAIVKNAENQWCKKTTKTTSSKRTIELPKAVIEIIKDKKNTGKNLIELNPNVISSRFSKVLKDLGIHHFRFHDLRHYNASVMLALGVPDKYAMARMGHSTPNMLKKVYQHLMTEKEKEVNDNINNFFNNL